MSARSCIGEPISWLRLELYATDRSDRALGEHLAACPACRQCFDEIDRDVVALPLLAVAATAPRRARWWWFAVPALAAAAIAIVVLRPHEPAFSRTASVKGVGDVVLGLVRDRGGTIRDDVATFAPGDRWKVAVTCDPAKATWIDVAVVEVGDGATAADHPLAPARVACGNQVVVPGAFELTGGKPNRVCVRVAAERAPRRALPAPGERDVACVTVIPER